jgi:uncharacterized protein
MIFMLRLRSLLVCLGLLPAALYCQPIVAADEVPVPTLSSPVTDLTNTLTAEQKSTLETTLRAYEARKGSQIAVLLVSTTQPETIEQFSIRVTDAWKLGRKNVDDGVLLTVAKNDRTVRIETGRGLEGVLTDATSNRIIRNVITPRFRNGEFYEGIGDAVTRIMQVIDGEALPEPANSSSTRDPDNPLPWPLLIFALVAGGGALRAIFGRLGAASITSVGVGLLIWWFMGSLLAPIVAGIFAFAFVLLSGGRGGGWSNGPRGWGGGGVGGGGFGGGGGGGWSGGGGGFSGGGSSGRW